MSKRSEHTRQERRSTPLLSYSSYRTSKNKKKKKANSPHFQKKQKESASVGTIESLGHGFFLYGHVSGKFWEDEAPEATFDSPSTGGTLSDDEEEASALLNELKRGNVRAVSATPSTGVTNGLNSQQIIALAMKEIAEEQRRENEEHAATAARAIENDEPYRVFCSVCGACRYSGIAAPPKQLLESRCYFCHSKARPADADIKEISTHYRSLREGIAESNRKKVADSLRSLRKTDGTRARRALGVVARRGGIPKATKGGN